MSIPEINHAHLVTHAPAASFEQMEAQDAYWQGLAWRAGWILGGNAGRVNWPRLEARAWQMIRELDRSLAACFDDEATRMEAVAHFDGVLEAGKRGDMSGEPAPCMPGCDHLLGSLASCAGHTHWDAAR